MPLDFLVYRKGKPVGIVGLYQIPTCKDEIFLNWLGVLPKYQGQGIGTQMLFRIFEIARKYKKKTFRIVTYKKLYIKANSIYRKMMQLEESYCNSKEDAEWIKFTEPEIFSSSFIDKKPHLLKNKFMNIKSDCELNERSIAKLREDKIIK